MPSGYSAVIARPFAISMPWPSPAAIRKQNRVYDCAWPPPARSAYNREYWSLLLLDKRTLAAPELATAPSRATVESLDDNAAHCANDPDSKSSLKKTPAAVPVPD